MATVITFQPSERTDHITADGTELTQRPYPFHATEAGDVLRQDFWRGDPARIIGVSARPVPGSLALWWHELVKDPQRAVGRYLVTQDARGDWAVHVIAISEVTVTEGGS